MAGKRILGTADPSTAYLAYRAARPIAAGLLLAACSSGATDPDARHAKVHGASRSTSSVAPNGTDSPGASAGGAGNSGPAPDAGTTTSGDDLGNGASNVGAGVSGDDTTTGAGGTNGGMDGENAVGGANAAVGGANAAAGGANADAGGANAAAGGANAGIAGASAGTGGTNGAGGGTGGTTPNSGGASSGAGGISAAAGAAGKGGAAGHPSSQMDAGTPAAGGAPSGTPRPKRVFITHARWDGNLILGAAEFGIQVNNGLAGADAICNWVALDAALGGHWVAWLSDSTHDAIDRIADVGPWYRMDGVEAFHNKAALTGNPLVPIQIDETHADTEAVPTPDGIPNIPWTGTLPGGTRSPSTCHDWVDNSPGDVGLCGANTATTERKWSDLGEPPCNRPYHLYCFEQ
jgi:hypothetical protein